MNAENHVEKQLHRLMPRGPKSELRDRVLDGVRHELSSDGVSRWQRRLGLAVAASLLLSVMLNVWVIKTLDRRMARLYGPRPVPRQIAEVAEAIAAVTDAETGRRFERQLTAVWRSHVARLPHETIDYMHIMRQLELVREDPHHEDTLQEGLETDRDRFRGNRRDSSGCQRHLGLEDRFTA